MTLFQSCILLRIVIILYSHVGIFEYTFTWRVQPVMMGVVRNPVIYILGTIAIGRYVQERRIRPCLLYLVEAEDKGDQMG